MKRSLLFIIFLMAVCFQVTTWAQAPNHLKYFSYYGLDSIGSCPGSTACHDEVNHANVNFVRVAYNDDQQIYDANIHAAIDLINNSASAHGMKSIVHINDIFVHGCSLYWNPNDPDRCLLRSNYANNWAAFQSHLTPAVRANIAAFLSVDEPFWNAYLCGVSKVTMKTNLETINSTIKVSIPNIPIYLNFAIPELTAGHPAEIPGLLPDNTDWVSFDCYGDYDNCQGTGHSVEWFLKGSDNPNSLKARIVAKEAQTNKTIKMVLVPDGQLLPGWPHDINALLGRIDNYYSLAKSVWRVIGMFSYLWAGYQDGAEWYHGTRDVTPVDMGAVRTKYTVIGNEIKAPKPDPAMYNDIPGTDTYTVVGKNFLIAGWAIDQGALTGTGVDVVAIWCYPEENFPNNPFLVAVANYGGGSGRTDIAAIFGPQFLYSSYGIWTSQGVGYNNFEVGKTYHIRVNPHSTVSGAWDERWFTVYVAWE